MAKSTCPKCEHGRFEVKVVEPDGSEYKEVFVQCSSCGGVVGVMGYLDAGVLVQNQQKELEALKQSIQRVEHQLQQIASRLR
jgi:hypothetical protein